jgi:hypothetical protein
LRGIPGANTASPETIEKKTLLKRWQNAAKTVTLVGPKAVNSFQYKGRKMGCNHIIPTAPFSFNDGGRQHSKRPRQQNGCTVRAIAIACDFYYDSAYDLLKANGRKCSRGINPRRESSSGPADVGWRSLCAKLLELERKTFATEIRTASAVTTLA